MSDVPSDARDPARHESPNIDLRAVAVTLAVLFGLLAVGLGISAMMMKLAFGGLTLYTAPIPQFAEPALQLAPSNDLAAMRQRDRQRLAHGLPMQIEQAMDLVVKRGRDAFSGFQVPDEGRGGH